MLQQVSRRVVQQVYAAEQHEGVNVIVRRALGNRELRNLSPFLMLDEFNVGEGSGFADHPHRGQTTVTYMLEGYMQHEDFAGHKGNIGPGDVQWMMVGKGIMHAEIPKHRDEKGNKLPSPHGLQLWIDLPPEAKKADPSYQEFVGANLPSATPRSDEPAEREGKGWHVKVVSGVSHGVKSPLKLPQNGGCYYMDVRLEPGGWIFQDIPHGWNAFVYGMDGQVKIGDSDKIFDAHNTLVLSNPALHSETTDEAKHVLSNTDGVRIENLSQDKHAHVFVIAGEPMTHEVVQYGPFVMSSRKEVYEAIEDFQNARNGFERAANWQSDIAKTLRH
ncbi:hypothetical protein MVES1_003167 [Malassezia vespertilionis]|uniref:Pirin n=1 Tax=Malassezia vespertilionis TaxID=2020962 RepID=A0A2N1J935_9BASI|nr:uncharacterized protein MVES1_003167 [Malassezia vespertilionis]PKI83058.1 hypothetical protein MVES_003006 [Malassezia vespertilionis]WFD07796.1 hypothetical protein MVES1_003167 [Malassezia vespertilionis]